MDAIAARPKPAGDDRPNTSKIRSWTVEVDGPNATSTAGYAGSERTSAAFAGIVHASKTDHTETAAMACVASEIARFLSIVQENTLPSSDIRAFIVGRCGAGAAIVGWRSWGGGAKEQPITARGGDRGGAAKALQLVPSGADVGMGHFADKSGHVTVLAYTVDKPQLEEVPLDAGKSGGVTIRGKLALRTEWVTASVTYGDLGAKYCERQFNGGAEGEFTFVCPTQPTDAAATVEVTVAPIGALLGRTVARIWISPNGTLPKTYEAPAYELPTDGSSFDAGSVLAGMNSLRHKVELPPLRTAPEQNRVLSNLLPFLLSAEHTSLQNTITLGLLAGLPSRRDDPSRRLLDDHQQQRSDFRPVDRVRDVLSQLQAVVLRSRDRHRLHGRV